MASIGFQYNLLLLIIYEQLASLSILPQYLIMIQRVTDKLLIIDQFKMTEYAIIFRMVHNKTQ